MSEEKESQIKFRAWNSDKKKMQYPHIGEAYISCLAGVGNSCVVEHLHTEPVRGGTYRTFIKDEFNGHIMQCIDEYDENGKEIYDGDIVEYCTEDGVYRATVCRGACRYCEDADYSNHIADGYIIVGPHKVRDYEEDEDGFGYTVVGNIYEGVYAKSM